MRRRDLLGLSAGAIFGLTFAPPVVQAKAFIDSAGRRIDVPDAIRRIFPAGPPASVTLFAVAPDKMLGWTRDPGPEALPFLPARYAELPEIGRLTGRGNTVNLENVVRLAPDLVLDVGSMTGTYVSLADQVQEQTHIPAVLIGGRLAETATTLRTVGGLLGVPKRPEALARYAETVLGGVQAAVAGSIASEVVDLVGARNVVGKDIGPRAIVDASPEQILAWQPDVILTVDRRFYAAARTDPVWREVKAVQAEHIHFVPDLPFSWFDNPPAANRLIGLLWLGKLLYPASFPQDIRAEARRFYALFYQQEPTDVQLAELLANPPA